MAMLTTDNTTAKAIPALDEAEPDARLLNKPDTAPETKKTQSIKYKCLEDDASAVMMILMGHAYQPWCPRHNSSCPMSPHMYCLYHKDHEGCRIQEYL